MRSRTFNQCKMDDGTLATLAGAARDFVRDWRTLAGIEVFVVLVSFAVITPMSEALLMLVATSIGITIFGQACLMMVGIARARGGRVRVRDAVAQAATRAISILRLTLALFVRLLVLSFPFIAAIGAI